MPGKDAIRVYLDPETRDVIDRIPRSERSRFIRVCILHGMGVGRRVCGLDPLPVDTDAAIPYEVTHG